MWPTDTLTGNKLPFNLKEVDNVDSFKKMLKTYLFKNSYDPVSKRVTIEYKV